VIHGTILAEFEFCSKFCWNHLIILAGPSAKIDSSGIPGIARILADSGRNQWRTVKTSNPGLSRTPPDVAADICQIEKLFDAIVFLLFGMYYTTCNS